MRVFLLVAVVSAAAGQEPAPADKRAFGVMPNYKTVEPGTSTTQLSAKEKFTIAAKDTFDYPIFFVSGVLAGISHLSNQNPSFGQGLKGYAKRYGTGYTDQVITTITLEGVYPTLFHQDPRYFRKGSGSGGARVGYALSRILVGRTDGGRATLNFPEILSNATGAVAGNLYYREHTRLGDNVSRFTTLIAADALGNLLKEFWPDVKRKFLTKRSTTQP